MTSRVLIVVLAALTAACGSSSPTSPSSTTSNSTSSIADPSVSETWSSTVPVGGAKFYSFSIAANGTVNVTLSSVSGDFVPATVTLGLGIGQPSGTECSTTSTVNASVQTAAPQLTGTYSPGVYCVRVFDVGNLFAPANVTVVVAHP
jgi:hypothetical protein